MPGDRHGWKGLDQYLSIHDAYLKRFDYFIEANSISFIVAGPESIVMQGRLACVGGAYLDVRNILALNRRNQVRTIRYSYHAGLKGAEDRPLFRYDNAHRYERAGHADEHHKHIFDESGREAADPIWVGADRWPTLGEVLAELEEWWLETGRFQVNGERQ